LVEDASSVTVTGVVDFGIDRRTVLDPGITRCTIWSIESRRLDRAGRHDRQP
jgi:hypothetical protein